MARRRNGAAKLAVRAAGAAGAAALVLGAAAVGGAAGCLQILGDEGPFVLGTGGGGTGGAGAAGGSGGTGGTGGTEGCEPGAEEACYEGPDGTLDEGVCMGGMRTCAQDGIWGACTGQVLPGVETCASTDDEDCDKKECARWSLISGGDGGALGTALATDSKGNVIVAGYFGDKISLGDQMLDAATSGPLFVAKIDSSGTPIWAKGYGGSGLTQGSIKTVAADVDDGIILAGNFDGTLGLGGNVLTSKANDFFVAKLNPNGAHAWSRGYGGDQDQDMWNMVLDSNGDILLGGSYADGYLIGGNSVSGAGAFVARLSTSDGDVISAKAFDPLVGTSATPQIASGPTGTWVLSGNCSNGATIGGMILDPCENFVANFDADGSLLWAVSEPGRPKALLISSDGSILISGDYVGTLDFGKGALTSNGLLDIFLAKLDPEDGTTQWSRSFGGPENDLASRLAIDSQDRIYLSVDADDDIDFGGGLLRGAGLSDSFVVALDADGSHRWSRVFGDATTQASTFLALRGGDAGLIVSVNTPGEIDFGAGAMQSTLYGLAVAELGP